MAIFPRGMIFKLIRSFFKTGKETIMSCNSAIYTVNSTNATITTTDDAFVQVPFGSVIRRFGCALGLDGGGIIACGSGYFDCDVVLTVLPTVAGDVTAQLFKDGVAIPGAIAMGSAGTAGDPVALPINALVRNIGKRFNCVLSVKVNASCTIANCSCVIEKL